MKIIFLIIIICIYNSFAEFDRKTVQIGDKFVIDTAIVINHSNPPYKISGEIHISNPFVLYIEEIYINNKSANIEVNYNTVNFDLTIDLMPDQILTFKINMIALAGNDSICYLTIRSFLVNGSAIDTLNSVIFIKNPFFNDIYIRLAWIEDIYPNPAFASNEFFILFNIDSDSESNLEFYDINGRLSYEYSLGLCKSGLNLKKIPFQNNISVGLYYIQLKTNSGVDFRKIIIYR